MKFKPHIVFDLLVLLFFAYMVWEAKEWKIQARNPGGTWSETLSIAVT